MRKRPSSITGRDRTGAISPATPFPPLRPSGQLYEHGPGRRSCLSGLSKPYVTKNLHVGLNIYLHFRFAFRILCPNHKTITTMKKFTTLLSALAVFAFIVCSCEKNPGGMEYSSSVIYILEGDELRDAQGYTVSLPASGCEKDLRVVYPETNTPLARLSIFYDKKITDGTSAAVLDDEAYYDTVRTDYYDEFPRYVSTVRISAGRNDSGWRKKSEFTVVAHIGDGVAARIKVVQEKR